MSLDLVDLNDVRQAMLSEVEHDVSASTLLRSKRFTDSGWAVYADLLRDAVNRGNDTSLTGALAQPEFWLAQEQSHSSKGKAFMKKVPVNAHETFAESEFNRFYLRGLCRVALDRGITGVVVYRAKAVSAPRPESEALIGTSLDPSTLLEDLRNSIGVDTALGLPPGPNSGLSAKLGD